MRKFWGILISPHPSLIDLGERWRVQLSMAFSLFIALGMLGPLLFSKHDSLARDLIIDGLVLVTIVSYLLGHSRSYKWGPVLLVFGIALMGFGLILTGNANDPSAALNTTMPLALVIGSATLSLRGQLFLTLFSGVGPMFLPSAMSNGTFRDGGIFLTLGALLMSITILRNRLEQKRLDELLVANQALQVIQATLEERVNERTSLAETALAEAEIARKTAETQVWFMQGQAHLAERMRGDQSTDMLANNVVSQLCQYLGAQTGALFLIVNQKLKLTGRYAYIGHSVQKDEFGLDENLMGEAARENHVITLKAMDDVPLIASALGNTRPNQLLLAPFGTDRQVLGVLELATLGTFSDEHREFLHLTGESIAIAFQTAQARDRIADLLLESQQQAEELQSQEEELRSANEELRAQAENMRNRF